MKPLSYLIHNPNPLTLHSTVSVKHACEEMRDQRTSAVLVTHLQGHLIGIFTGRDAIWRVLADGKNPSEVTLGDVMTPNPVTMTTYNTSIEALRLMSDGGFRHLPVVDKGVVIGLVLRRDFKGEDLNRLEEEREFWEHAR